jgi:signal transduction histidine kinase
LSRGREHLDAAGETLARLRQVAGLPPADAPGAAGLRAAGAAVEAALETARARLADLSDELRSERARAEAGEADNRRLQEELEARPGEEALEAARDQARQEALGQRAELETRVRILTERLTLLQAELVRLESLRRKAELAVSDGEKSRRAVEETLRRELRQAHAALDSAAAAAGAREGQVRADIESMHARLDAASQRLQEVEKERRRLAARAKEEAQLLSTQPGLRDLAAELVAERQRADDAILSGNVLRTELEELRRERSELALRAQALDERLMRQQADLSRLELEKREALARETSLEGRLRAELEAQAREARERDDVKAQLKESEKKFASIEREFRRAESLRVAAEGGLGDAENSRRASEDKLGHELRAAHAALEEANGRAQALDARLTSQQADLARLESQKRETLAREASLEGRLRAEFEAQAREARERDDVKAQLTESKKQFASIESELRRAESLRVAAEGSLGDAENSRRAIEDKLGHELRAAHAALEEANGRAQALRQRAELAAQEEAAATAAAPDLSVNAEADFILPPIEPMLESGWARLLRLVRPPVEAAYGHLRRLSAVPLAAGPRALVRLTAVSLSQAEEALTAIELVLSDAPPVVPPSNAGATLELSLTAWEPALRRQEIALVRDIPRVLPDAVHEPRALRALVYQIMRNALEALPRGSRLAVTASRSQDGALRVDFSDDGPGFPSQWLEKRFEPFVAARRGHAGLGLAAAERTLKRWGGSAEAANGSGGRGARLSLLFAVPLLEGPQPVTLQPG